MTRTLPMPVRPLLLTSILATALAGLVHAGGPVLTSVTYPFGQGIGASGVAAADFDGDGDMDLAAGNEFTAAASNNRLAIWSNDGTGVMSISALVPLPAMPKDVVSGDFNGDGHADIAVAIFVPGNLISIFLNDGQGGFPVRVDKDVNSIPTALAAADLDGDGDVDLAFTLRSILDHHIGVLLNDGSGGFPEPFTKYPIGFMPNDVAIGDLNEDGLPELVGTAYDTPVLSVLPNLGGGLFGPADSYPVGQRPAAVVTGDLDGDGHVDVLVSNSQSTFLSIFFNDGSGALTPTTNPVCCQSGTAMELGDLDGDGHPDLIINLSTTTMTVLRNRGDGSFVRLADVVKGPATTSVTVADMDQDGDLDFATVNDFPLGNPSITVALSTIPQVWTDLGGGTSGVAGPSTLTSAGPLTPGSSLSLTLDQAPASTPMGLLLSFASLPQPFVGGTLFANPASNTFLVSSDTSGAFELSTTWPAGIPPSQELYLQFLVRDTSLIPAISLSNAVKAVTP